MRPSAISAAVLLATSVLGVGRLQAQLAKTVHAVKEGEDVYALPPPAELHWATLGWEAAAVDLLWASLLVEYGMHWSEHREFRSVPNYVDAILELEPTYAPVYRYIDTMLAYRPLQGTEEDIRAARRYLERGLRERRDDARIWMQYGEFMAFIAPSFLHDQSEQDAYRKAGAEAIGHAVELGGDADKALSAAAVLTRVGATEAGIRYLERAYAITPSSSEEHKAIGRKLSALKATAFSDSTDATLRAIEARWRRELPELSPDLYLLVGPKVDVARCSGLGAAGDLDCVRDWVSVKPPESSEDSR